MNRDEFIGKLQLCYFGDRNAFEEIVSVYDKYKSILDKIKEYVNDVIIDETYTNYINELLEEIE